MLFEMEISLNNVTAPGPPPISIPYFDWTTSANKISSSSVFQDRFDPFCGHDVAHPIPAAHATGNNSRYRTTHTSEHDVIRMGSLDINGSPFQLATRDVLNLAITSNPICAYYAELLEGFHHTPHSAI